MTLLHPTRILSFLVLLQTTKAHFTLSYPQPVGAFSDDDEPNASCGGYTPDFSKNPVTDFHIGGDAISTQSSHPQTNFLYRITTDPQAAGNWTEIYPIVQQSGVGNFCPAAVSVPPRFVGSKVVLSIVANGPDGLLYQCAVVNLVNGTSPSTPDACTNSSGVTGAFTADSTLTAQLSDNSTTTKKSPAAATYGSVNAGFKLLTCSFVLVMGTLVFI